MLKKNFLKFDKQILFIKCNFRIFITIIFVSFIIAIYLFIYNHPFINNLSQNKRFAAIFTVSVTIVLILVIYKTVRDFIAIKLQNKGKGSLIQKTSIKRK